MKLGLSIGMVLLGVAIAGLSVAKTPAAELLEKGIYTEETVGDLEKAATIYQEVIDETDAARPYAAQAHLRLGLCYLKLGRVDKAMALFRKLSAAFPEQEDLVAEANRQLEGAGRLLDRGQVKSRVDAAVQTISTCREGDPRVVEALATLKGLDPEVVATELAGYLGSDQATMRRSAVYILWQGEIQAIGPAVPGLLKLCTHEEDVTRGMAALALGGRKVDNAFDTLCAMTSDDPSGYARRCGAYALGLLGNHEARPVLEKALQDRDSMVANNAQAALAMLDETKAEAAGTAPAAKPSYSQTHHVELLPDGSGLHSSTSSHVNQSDQSLHSYGFINSYNTIEKVLDENDQELTFKVERKGNHYSYLVERRSPVPPGESYLSKIVIRNDEMATRRGDVWVYNRNHTPIPETDYTETVQLPPGATLIAVEPEPTVRTEVNGALALRFEKILRRNEAFRCAITYRLQPDGPAAAAPATSVQILIDAAQPGSVVMVPKGVFGEPLTINKPLTLRGVDAAACVLEMTSDQPALLITSTEPVLIESLTVKWQRATSQRQPDPACAVVLRDSPATLRNLRIKALGGDTRCPSAVMAMGFSTLTMTDCRMDGFEYTVQIGGGASGTIEDCVVLNPGHCGITVGGDGKGTLRRNLVTGSKFHGIRCTGGQIQVEDNLIVQNANRGIYLGNRSASGAIRNNLILGNATGISGFGQSRLGIENNLILDSTYAGLDFRASCRFTVNRNILAGNTRGVVLFSEGDEKMNTTLGQNTFWDNRTDAESLDLPAESLRLDPQFAAADQGDFAVGQAALRDAGQGLQDAAPFRALWAKWVSHRGS